MRCKPLTPIASAACAIGACVGVVLAQGAAGVSIEELVRQAQAKADGMTAVVAGIVSPSAADRSRDYGREAKALSDANHDRLRHGLAYLAPAYQSDPYQPPETEDGIVYVAVSLSMPKASLRQLARDAQRAHAVLVLRGLVDGSFAKTQAGLKAVFVEGEPAGLVIDPRVFEQYHVERVPSFIAAPSPVEPCEAGLDCARPDVPYDVVRGNITLQAALRILADKGTDAPGVAANALARMGS